MGQDKKKSVSGANRAAPVVSGQCADGIAVGMAQVPEEEKPTHRRAILRNRRACLELSRWMRMAGGGR